MAANTLPSGIGDLFILAERMANGLTTHGPWLLQGSITADEFSQLLRDAREAESALVRARAARSEAAKAFAATNANLTSWLAKARLVVMLALGGKWSASWIAAGFTSRGTNVPKRIGQRIELTRRLTDFFARHREYEVAFAEVTATKARTLHAEIATAERNTRITTAAVIANKRARDKAERRLRAKMRKVRILLSISLGQSDPRWLAFGLKRPGNYDRPTHPVTDGAASEPVKVEFGAGADIPATETAVA